MADTRRIIGWLAVGAALALACVLVLLVLREDEPVAVPAPGGAVVSRTTDARPHPDKPVISVPEAERRAPPPRPPEVVTTGSVSGRLVNAEHQPFSSGRIEALQGDNAGVPGLVDLVSLGRRAVADAGGRFTLADVPAIPDLTLRLEGETFPPAEVGPYLVTVGKTTDLGDIVLQPGLAITGTVFDDLGAPVAGARIGLLQGSPPAPDDGYAEPSVPEPSRLVLSDDAGRFRIENAARDSFMLMVSATGFANALFPGSAGLDEKAAIDMPLHMRRAGVLHGRVLDGEDERPLAGVHVFAEPMDQGSGRSESMTGADGAFVIRDIVPGNYALTASLKGYSRGRERTFDETPDAEVVLHLDRQGSLAGTVVGSDGRPVRAFDLQPRFRRRRMDPPVARGSFQRVSSADGSFEATGLDPGFWSIDVWAKGYSLTSSDAVKIKQGEAAGGLVVTLLRGSTLTGVVRDADGQLVAGAEVTLHANREPEVDFLRDTTPIPGVTHGTHTDADGRFKLEDLSARAYQVQVDHPDYAIVRRNDVTLAAEAELEAEPFVLERAATVRGTAVGPSGEPLAGVSVSLTAVNGFARQATTDGHGQFVFTRVRVDDYQLVCYGRQLSFSAMIASVKNPPEAFHVSAGADVQRNAISFE